MQMTIVVYYLTQSNFFRAMNGSQNIFLSLKQLMSLTDDLKSEQIVELSDFLHAMTGDRSESISFSIG